MNKDILKAVLADYQNEIPKHNVIPRKFRFEEFGNYIFVGIRRAGKSYLLYQRIQELLAGGIGWDEMLYINFEDERLENMNVADLNLLLEVHLEMYGKRPILFLDEIQNILGWEKFARRLADSKYRVYITGSNAKMLSQEIENRLGGRYLTKYITPYNFKEFLTAKQIDFSDKSIFGTKESGKIKREFSEYFYFGGFPETLNYQNKREYVSSIYQKVLLGDIAARNSIRNPNGLQILMKKIAESVKDEISYSKLHNILKTIGVKISKDIVIDYIGYAKQSFLIFTIKNYFSKFVEKETTPKYYFNDNGLLNLFLNKEEPRLLENLVAINLWNIYKSNVYYLKSQNLDVDFFIEETGTAIQVAYSITNISDDRETKSLVEAAKTLKEAKEFVIITYEEEKELNIDGVKIQVIPVWKWLLKIQN